MRNASKYIATTLSLIVWTSSAHAEVDARDRAAAAQAEKEALSKQLWDWYRQATEFHDAGQLSEAWALYQRVWKHRKTYDVATSLGGVCLQRAEYAAAAHYYRFALDQMVPTQSPKFVAQVKEAFERARAEVTALEISVAPVNGRPVKPVTVTDQRSNLPLEEPIYLEPGEPTLEARAPGYGPLSVQVEAKPGATLKWHIDFGSASDSEVTNSVSERTATERHPWIVFPVGGLVTAGLAYGAWHNARRGEQAYDAAAAFALQPGDCSGASGGESCARAVDLRRRAQDADMRAYWFGGGAVLAAVTTGIVYWLWETDVPVRVSVNPIENHGEVRWTYDF